MNIRFSCNFKHNIDGMEIFPGFAFLILSENLKTFFSFPSLKRNYIFLSYFCSKAQMCRSLAIGKVNKMSLTQFILKRQGSIEVVRSWNQVTLEAIPICPMPTHLQFKPLPFKKTSKQRHQRTWNQQDQSISSIQGVKMVRCGDLMILHCTMTLLARRQQWSCLINIMVVQDLEVVSLNWRKPGGQLHLG